MEKSAPPEQLKATIVKEVSKDYADSGNLQSVEYKVKLKGSEKTVQADFQPTPLNNSFPKTGSTVVVIKQLAQDGTTQYLITDSYRLPGLLIFFVLFVVCAVVILGKKSIGSLLGLGVSLLVILFGIVPAILHGYDPLLMTLIGAFIIMFLTTYLAHGVNKKTTVALVSTFVSLLITFVLAYASILLLNLSGSGSEDAMDLYYATNSAINAKGLLLSGIIIGTLGALNDVTVTQAATIFEMKKLSQKISFLELVKRGISVGQEHGASMINTIVLAYAGSSLFIFFYFIINPQAQPLWAILNNEFMAEEIVKTLAGTIGILLSIPIVTVIAAYVVEKGIPFLKK